MNLTLIAFKIDFMSKQISAWSKAKLAYHFFRGIRNPNDPSHSIKLGAALWESGALDVSVEKLKRYPGGLEFFKAKDFKFDHDLGFLSGCPQGTVGHCYYEHLASKNLDPNIFPETEITDDASYLEALVRRTHDLWHLTTGFDTSIVGELGLQAFMATQMNWPFSMMAIAGGSLLTLFKERDKIDDLVDSIARGKQLGATMSPLIFVNWNETWHTPLEDLRTELRQFSAKCC